MLFLIIAQKQKTYSSRPPSVMADHGIIHLTQVSSLSARLEHRLNMLWLWRPMRELVTVATAQVASVCWFWSVSRSILSVSSLLCYRRWQLFLASLQLFLERASPAGAVGCEILPVYAYVQRPSFEAPWKGCLCLQGWKPWWERWMWQRHLLLSALILELSEGEDHAHRRPFSSEATLWFWEDTPSQLLQANQ